MIKIDTIEYNLKNKDVKIKNSNPLTKSMKIYSNVSVLYTLIIKEPIKQSTKPNILCVPL